MPRSVEALERRREYDRSRATAKNAAYYAANRERENARCKAYHHGNRPARLAKKAKYRESTAEIASEKQRARRLANLADFKSRERARRESGIDKPYQARWREENRERERQRQAQWTKDNAARVRAKCARRRALKLRATPTWADAAKIEAIYAEAVRLTRETGVPHEVDHFYPLQGRNVCGLHVETNLWVITRTANRRKNNREGREAEYEPVRLRDYAGEVAQHTA